MLRALSEKEGSYTFILYSIKDTLAKRVRAQSEPNADERKCTSTNEGKRFVDTKPEDISSRFLRLASASAQMTFH